VSLTAHLHLASRLRTKLSCASTWHIQKYKCFYSHRPRFVLCDLYRTEESVALRWQYFELYWVQAAFMKWELGRIVDCPYNYGQYSLITSVVSRALQITVRTLRVESIGFFLSSVLPSSTISDWPFAGFIYRIYRTQHVQQAWVFMEI
jgi:hypothetical protein